MLEGLEFAREIEGVDFLIGREEELQMLKESLYKKRMKNAILVGNAGCGKTTLIQKLAYDLKTKFKFVEFDVGASLSQTSLRGQFEEKMVAFFRKMATYNRNNHRKMVLFIDEVHNIYQTGGVEGCVSLGEIIKPFLSNGSITLIGATTKTEYESTIKKDKALNRRLSPIFIGDLNDKACLEILKQFSGGKVSAAMLNYILAETNKLGKTQPDVAIDVLDWCMAKRKFSGDSITPEMVDKVINYVKEK